MRKERRKESTAQSSDGGGSRFSLSILFVELASRDRGTSAFRESPANRSDTEDLDVIGPPPKIDSAINYGITKLQCGYRIKVT
jgi:hypothetical protein